MKICSLLPSGTEILFALGLGDQVVGVSDLCDFPPEANGRQIVSHSLLDTRTLSSVQIEAQLQSFLRDRKSPYQLDIALLREIRPELILTQDTCFVCDVDAKEVKSALSGIHPAPRILVLGPKTISQILDTFVETARAAGAPESGVQLANAFRDRLARVAAGLKRERKRPRVMSIEGTNPLVAGGNWLPEMKSLAGGVDELFQPGCAAQRLCWESIRDYDPDVLLITPCSSDPARSFRELDNIFPPDGWAQMTAVRTRSVYIIDHVYFSRPGPRIAQGVEILAQILHPQLFQGMIPPGATIRVRPPLR